MTGKNRLKMENMQLTGDAQQTADQGGTEMDMRHITAKNAVQRLTTTLQTLEVFGWKGKGLVAVVGLVIIALASIAFKFLQK